MLRTLGRLALGRCFRRLELPSALPYLFSGAKVAVAVAVIGAVFGELVGSDAGLGHAIQVGHGPAADGARVRRRAAPVGDGDRAVRARVGARAAAPCRGPGRPEGAGVTAGARSGPGRARARCRMLRSPACGEKSEAVGGDARAAPARPGARLVPEPRPRRDLRGAETRATSATWGWTCSPRVPSDPSAPIKQVAAGRVDLAISYEPEVLLAREQGLPVVAVAALVQRPLTSLMATRKSRRAVGARPARQARRHRRDSLPVGLPEDDPRARANVPGPRSRRPTSAPACCRRCCPGKVDATLGAFWNVEGVELRQRRKRPWIAAGRPARRPRLRRAGAGRQRGQPSRTSATTCACSSRRVARGARAGPRATRAGAARRCSTPTPT